MPLPIVAEEFWIGTEPELKFTDGGRGYCKFRVKAVDRIKDDREPTGYRNGDTLWATATVWDGRGENAVAQHTFESVKKGDSVVLTGKIYTRDHEGKTYVEIRVDKIGPSLAFRTTPHGAGLEGNSQRTAPPPAREEQPAATVASGGSDNEPPF